MTLRLRLTLSYLVLILVTSTAISLFLFDVLERVYSDLLAWDLDRQAAISSVEVTRFLLAGQTPELRGYLRELDRRTPARVVVFTRQGQLLASSEIDDEPLLGQTVELPGVADALAGRTGRGVYFMPSGMEVVYVYRPLVDGDGQLLGALRLSYNLENVVSFLRQLQLFVALSIAAAALVSILVGLGLARMILKPLGDLSRAAEALAQGNLGVRAPVRTPDEVGRVIDTFNRMAERLQHMEQERRAFLAAIGSDDRVLTDRILSGLEIQARRMARLTDDLVTIDRLEAGRLELQVRPVDLNRLVWEVGEQFLAEARFRGLELVVEKAEQPAFVETDPDRLAQAYANLVSNALKYTPPDGQVRLWVRRQPLPGGGDGYRLAVTDSGPGIPPEEVDRIFDRYYRGTAAGTARGSGLGLAIVRDIAEALGATVSVESDPGSGTTFSIWVRTAGPQPSHRPGPRLASRQPG
jgi:two-component system sensor histidine kinase BaeS